MDCIGTPVSTIKLRKGLSLLREVTLEDAALKLLQPAPLCLSLLSRDVSYDWPTGVGPFESLHRPNRLGLDCMGIKEDQSFRILYEHQPCLPTMRAL